MAALPRCTGLPLLTTPAQAFGCLYVLEGATLGGQLTSRLLAQRFGLGSDHGGAFFASYGEQVGPMWWGFRAALSTFAADTGTDEAIVQTACDTFAAFENWVVPGRDRDERPE